MSNSKDLIPNRQAVKSTLLSPEQRKLVRLILVDEMCLEEVCEHFDKSSVEILDMCKEINEIVA